MASKSSRVLTCLLTLCLTFFLHAVVTANGDDDAPLLSNWLTRDVPFEVHDGFYYYQFFVSNTVITNAQRDGASGVGSMCNPGFGITAQSLDNIIFSDMCGGSTIRLVNATGLFTLAGSPGETGMRDGTQALFGGSVRGTFTKGNAVTMIDDVIFLADTQNNRIRRIYADGDTDTFIDNTTLVDQKALSGPMFVSPFGQPIANVLISDTGNNRILSVPVNAPQFASTYTTAANFQPSLLATAVSKGSMFFINATFNLGALELANARDTWSPGDRQCMGYSSSLMLNADDSRVLYYGTVNGVSGVYGLSTTRPSSGAALPCPTLLFPWPYASSSEGTVITMLARDATSWYVMLERSVYVVSSGAIDFTTTPPAPASSSSSFSGGSIGSLSSSLSGGSQSSSAPPPGPYDNRQHGIAAFPMDALPSDDPCLMSQLYHWLRTDAAAAYSTTDYYSQFVPLGDPSKAIFGTVNVSSWCGNITSRTSNDGTIEIVDFWGPTGLSLWYTNRGLYQSPWYWTRQFLDGLRRQGRELGPFCFINCTDTCVTATYTPDMCIDYKAPPKCDDICKGAIAASVVMAVTGVVLIVLMIVSPSNVYNALVMLPLL